MVATTLELPPLAVITTFHVPAVANCATPPNAHESAVGGILDSNEHAGAAPTPFVSVIAPTFHMLAPPRKVSTPPCNGQLARAELGVLLQYDNDMLTNDGGKA
jgi:hypothetical protein